VARSAAIQCDIRDGTAVDAMMGAVWREAPLDILINNCPPRRSSRQTEHLSIFAPRMRSLAPTLHGTMYCTLAAGKRWIEGGHKGVVLSILFDLDHHRPSLHSAFRDGRNPPFLADDQKPSRWNGDPKASARWRLRRARFPTAGPHRAQLRPEGRDQRMDIPKPARPRRRTQRALPIWRVS